MGFRDFFGGKPKHIEFSKMTSPDASAESHQNQQEQASDPFTAAVKEMGYEEARRRLEQMTPDVERSMGQSMDSAIKKTKETLGRIGGMFKRGWGGTVGRADEVYHAVGEFVDGGVDNFKNSKIETYGRELGIDSSRIPARLDSHESTQLILGLDSSKRSTAGNVLSGFKIINAIREYRQQVSAIRNAYKQQLRSESLAGSGARAESYFKESEEGDVFDLRYDAAKARYQRRKEERKAAGRPAEYFEAAERERQRIEESSAEKARQISRDITQREAAQAAQQEAQQARLERYQTAVGRERNRTSASLERATSETAALKLNSFAEYQREYDRWSQVEGNENVPQGPRYFEVGTDRDPSWLRGSKGEHQDNTEHKMAA